MSRKLQFQNLNQTSVTSFKPKTFYKTRIVTFVTNSTSELWQLSVASSTFPKSQLASIESVSSPVSYHWSLNKMSYLDSHWQVKTMNGLGSHIDTCHWQRKTFNDWTNLGPKNICTLGETGVCKRSRWSLPRVLQVFSQSNLRDKNTWNIAI